MAASPQPKFQDVDAEGEPIRDIVSRYPIPLYARSEADAPTLTDDIVKALLFMALGFSAGFVATAVVCWF